jgi:hypothetical protein
VASDATGGNALADFHLSALPVESFKRTRHAHNFNVADFSLETPFCLFRPFRRGFFRATLACGAFVLGVAVSMWEESATAARLGIALAIFTRQRRIENHP